MENQHQQITGYRDLSEEEIKLLNEIKAKAEEVGALLKHIEDISVPDSKGNGSKPDRRWIGIARTHLQQGFMALNRSVAKPTSF